MDPDGFIGHTVLWGHPLDLDRAIRYNIASRADLMTRTIQPPLLAWAWAWAVGGPRDEPRLAAHHAWLREHRALEDDGLLWLIQPDESGMDASPEVRPRLGSPRAGPPAVPPAHRAQPAARASTPAAWPPRDGRSCARC